MLYFRAVWQAKSAMSNPRVCLVSYEFPPTSGGEATYTYTLFNELSKSGTDVKVLTSEINKPVSDLAQIYYVPSISKPSLRLLTFCMGAKSKLEELNRRGEIDMIHYTNDYCGFALPTSQRSKPLISTMHHPFAAENKAYFREVKWRPLRFLRYHITRRPLIVNRLQRRLCKASDKLIAVSEFTAKAILEEHQIAPERLSVIHNGVDLERFSKDTSGDEFLQKLGLPRSNIVLYVGRLDHFKGLDYLIHALGHVVRDVPQAKLIIAGKGVLKSTLMELVRRLRLEKAVKFVGSVADSDLPKLYAACDVFVYPSLMEGFGLTLLEAMAMAKPCIAAASGGMPEIVGEGAGILVPPADKLSLSNAIHSVLEDKSLSRRIGEAGRRRVESKFTAPIMAQKTSALYASLLAR